jgi:hypothetical protein
LIASVISLLLLLTVSHGTCFSQKQDTIQSRQDTVNKRYQKHSPKKAAWMSTFLPGLGQIYNDKIWKVPIIYGAAGVVYYFYDMNADLYNEYSKAYRDFTNDRIDQYKGYDKAEELESAKDYYRRNRDLNIILFGVIYLANILDASVDAHLYNFDVSKNLSIKLQPTQINREFGQPIPAVSCSIYF